MMITWCSHINKVVQVGGWVGEVKLHMMVHAVCCLSSSFVAHRQMHSLVPPQPESSTCAPRCGVCCTSTAVLLLLRVQVAMMWGEPDQHQHMHPVRRQGVPHQLGSQPGT